MKGALVRTGLVALVVIGGVIAGPVQPKDQRAPSQSAVFSPKHPETPHTPGARSHSPVTIDDGDHDPENSQAPVPAGRQLEHQVEPAHDDITSIPEPATYALLGAGLIAFAVYRRRAASPSANH